MSEQGSFFSKPPAGHEFSDPARLKEFILSGKAIFTLYSEKSTYHFTYKVKAKGVGTYWIFRLGAENEWVYIGTISETERYPDTVFHKTPAVSPGVLNSDQFKAFDWFWKQLILKRRIGPQLKVYHEGKCGMCGAPLTDPLSIQLGYGPDCRKKKFRRPAIDDRVLS